MSATTNLQQLINIAKDTLLDTEKRRKYDRELLNAPGRENISRNGNSAETDYLRRRLQEMHQEKLQQQQREAQLQHQVRQSQQQAKQREAQLQQQVRQSQQQARQSEELVRQRNAKLKKERRELQNEKQRCEAEKIAQFRCGICSSIVPSFNFWASGCCSKLFCGECLINCGTIIVCQNVGCQQPIHTHPGSSSPVGWTQNHPFTKNLIEDFAPSCYGCKKNIPKSEFDTHTLACPALNQSCFKCNGTGTLPGPFNTLAACNICSKSGILRGDWTQCFACLDDTQAFDFTRFCQMCFGNKCFKGKWSPCFRCDCKGTVTQITTSLTKDYCPTMKVESRNETVLFQSITAMPKYADKSFEELRLESYTAATSPIEQLVTCDVCKGGKKLEGAWIKCISCQAGRMQMFDGTEAPCKICDGKGSVKSESVDVLRNTRPCPLCSGNGCGNCGFTGRIAA